MTPKSTQTYTRNQSFGGYTVRAAKTGWIVDTWSRVQGTSTGSKWIVPYCASFPADLDLAAEWNDHTSYGQAIAMMTEPAPTGRMVYGSRYIRRGHAVE